jgi:uroporphyrinogen decarboxylase
MSQAATSQAQSITSRQRVKMALGHEEPDRVPVHDSVWGATVDRWKGEGLPHHVPVDEYFGFELAGLGADITPRYPVAVVERNEEYIVERDAYGGLRMNHRDYSTTPEILDWPIKSREDWEHAKRRLEPSYTRVDWVSARERFETARAEGKFITYGGGLGYDLACRYMKSDEFLMLLVTEPIWVRDMFQTLADLLVEMARMMIREGFQFDGAFVTDDLGYKMGPFFSPRTYRELLLPVERQVCDFFHSQGMPVILHSCGNVKPLIPLLIEAGFDCLQPLEVKAGMDVVELKREYGRELAFMGGIDVRLMADPDPSRIEAEIARKFEAAKPGGGYIYHSDHSIPLNVSFGQYVHVMELVRKHGQY